MVDMRLYCLDDDAAGIIRNGHIEWAKKYIIKINNKKY